MCTSAHKNREFKIIFSQQKVWWPLFYILLLQECFYLLKRTNLNLKILINFYHYDCTSLTNTVNLRRTWRRGRIKKKSNTVGAHLSPIDALVDYQSDEKLTCCPSGRSVLSFRKLQCIWCIDSDSRSRKLYYAAVTRARVRLWTILLFKKIF